MRGVGRAKRRREKRFLFGRTDKPSASIGKKNARLKLEGGGGFQKGGGRDRADLPMQ